MPARRVSLAQTSAGLPHLLAHCSPPPGLGKQPDTPRAGAHLMLAGLDQVGSPQGPWGHLVSLRRPPAPLLGEEALGQS